MVVCLRKSWDEGLGHRPWPGYESQCATRAISPRANRRIRKKHTSTIFNQFQRAARRMAKYYGSFWDASLRTWVVLDIPPNMIGPVTQIIYTKIPPEDVDLYR